MTATLRKVVALVVIISHPQKIMAPQALAPHAAFPHPTPTMTLH